MQDQPAFSIIGGISFFIGLLPNIVFLVILALGHYPVPPLSLLLIFTVGAMWLTEMLFLRFCESRARSVKGLERWKETLSPVLFLKPNILGPSLIWIADLVVDLSILYMAAQGPLSSLTVFLIFIINKAIFSVVQGTVADVLNSMRLDLKQSLFLSCLASLVAFCGIADLMGYIQIDFAEMFGFNKTGPSLQTGLIVFLMIKATLGNSCIIAKALVANYIWAETLKLPIKDAATKNTLDDEETSESKFLRIVVSIFISLAAGVGISYFVMGTLNIWVVIPCVISSQLLARVWFLMAKRQPIEK